MQPNTLRRVVTIVCAVLALVVAVFPAPTPVHAATAAIGNFYGGCGNFSVDVAVSGTANDVNNVDKFRYLVTDGNGKWLYREDATRPINTTASSMVLNLSYDADGVADGAPGKNPITFSVMELDANGNQGATLASVSYDAPCLPVSGHANRFGTFVPPKYAVGVMTGDAQMFMAPNNGPLNLTARTGAQYFIYYRTPDSQWVAIFVGSPELIWIPASAIGADVSTVPTPPTHIDGSSLAPTAPTAAAAPVGAVTARVLVSALRLRAAPVLNAQILNVIPFNTILPVLGRSARRTFIQVNYNGQIGWVSSFFVRLTGARLADLPVTE